MDRFMYKNLQYKILRNFRINVGLPDLYKKKLCEKNSILKRKTATFLRKFKETNIHSKSFLKLYSAHFGI